MVYLYPNNDTFSIYTDISYLPEKYHKDVITLESLPQGEGILRRAEDGSFYFEQSTTVKEPPIIEQPTEPEPTETLEEKISRLFTVTEQNNLITVDAVLGVYEELIALREEVAALKGTSNNA